jgi:hypothetical protein
METQKSAVDKLIAKYNKQWNKYGMGSVISYSQVVAELEKVKEEMKQEQSQEKENQSLEEFINSQPYYGYCTPEYLEGIEEGAKWQQEKAKETQKLTMINALVEFSKANFDIHTEEAILNITRRAEKYYNKTFKSE